MSRDSRAARRRQEREAARSGRKGPEASPEDAAAASPGRGEALSWWRVLSLAVVFAVPAGFMEARLVHYVLSLGLPLRVSRDYVWMAPVAYLLALGLVALLLVAVGRFWSRAASRSVAMGVLSGLALGSFFLAIEWLHALAALLLAAGIGFQLGRMARGRPGAFLARFAPAAALVLILLLVGVAGWSRTDGSRAEARIHAALPAPTTTTNVVLIILDTVRAASMGLYQSTLANTPNLEVLAREAVVFDRAYAPSPWTLPSHATMFTGTWPFEHGASWKTPLDGRYPTLAEILAANGYATAAFVGNLTYTDHNFGLDRGFGRFEDYPVNLGQIVISSGLGRQLASTGWLRSLLGLHLPLNEVPAPAVTDRFLRWYRERESDRPFFAFLNYFDAHEPLDALLDPRPVVPVTHRSGLITGEDVGFDIPPNAEVRFFQAYRSAYEATIAELDREVGRLILALDRNGDLDETLVIVASDHGELIGEHRLFGHDNSLYVPTLHVPLLLRFPMAAPTGVRVEADVSLRDLPATVVDLVGLGRDAARLPGQSMAATWRDTAPAPPGADTVYAYLKRGPNQRIPPWAPVARGPVMESVVRGSLQFIQNGDGSEELYDFRSDPTQAQNLTGAPGAERLLSELRARLQGVRADSVH